MKSELGGHGISLKLREWNVRTLLNKTDKRGPECPTALVAKEFESYIIDITALSEAQSPPYDGMVDNGCTIFLEWQGREQVK